MAGGPIHSILFVKLQQNKKTPENTTKKSGLSNSPQPCVPRGHKKATQGNSAPFLGKKSAWGRGSGGTQTNTAYLGDEWRREEAYYRNVMHRRARCGTIQKGGSRPVRKLALVPCPLLRGLQSNGPLVTSFALGNRATLLCPVSGCLTPLLKV